MAYQSALKRVQPSFPVETTTRTPPPAARPRDDRTIGRLDGTAQEGRLFRISDVAETDRNEAISAIAYIAHANATSIVSSAAVAMRGTDTGGMLRIITTGEACAALVFLDIRERSLARARHHLYAAHMLGVRQLIVAVNDMALSGNEYEVFKGWRDAISRVAAPLHFPALLFIPLSASNGDMLVERGSGMDWYDGPTLLEALEELQAGDPATGHALPFFLHLPTPPDCAAPRRVSGEIDARASLRDDECLQT